MTKKSYSDLLKDPRWQKKRLIILDRDNFQCQWCGDTESTLHIHHSHYKGNPWEVEDYELSVICEKCHWIMHNKDNFNEIELALYSLVHEYSAPFVNYNSFKKCDLVHILDIITKNKIKNRNKVFSLLKLKGK